MMNFFIHSTVVQYMDTTQFVLNLDIPKLIHERITMSIVVYREPLPLPRCELSISSLFACPPTTMPLTLQIPYFLYLTEVVI